MKELKMKTPFSIKLIYWIVNGLFWILILGFVTIFVDNLLVIFNVNENPHFLFRMPLIKDILTISEVEINGEVIAVRIDKIMGGFNVWHLGTRFAIINLTVLFVIGALLIYLLALVKKMLISVKDNEVFTNKNVICLKKSSYSIFIIWILRDVFMYSYVKIQFGYFNPFNNLFMDYLLSNYLLTGAILLAVAHIFERGVKLQNYKDLTI